MTKYLKCKIKETHESPKLILKNELTYALQYTTALCTWNIWHYYKEDISLGEWIEMFCHIYMKQPRYTRLQSTKYYQKTQHAFINLKVIQPFVKNNTSSNYFLRGLTENRKFGEFRSLNIIRLSILNYICVLFSWYDSVLSTRFEIYV